MSKSVLVITLLSFFQFLIVFLPFIGKPSVEQGKSFRLTKIGIVLTICSVLVFAFSIVLYFSSQDDEADYQSRLAEAIQISDSTYNEKIRTRDEENVHQLEIRDIIHGQREDSISQLHRKQVDSSYIRSIKASNEALAKYNLEISDSLKKVASTINKKGSLAQLSLFPITDGQKIMFLTTENGKPSLNIQFISALATAYSVNLDCYVIKQNGTNYQILKQEKLFQASKFIIPDIKATGHIEIPPSCLLENKLFVLIIGSFCRDERCDEEVPFKKLLSFDFKNNTDMFEWEINEVILNRILPDKK